SLAQVSFRTPRELTLRARLAADGSQARDFLTAALKSEEHPRERERIYLALAQRHQAAHNLDELKETISAYQREFPRGEYAEDMLRLAVYLAERAGDLRAAGELNSRLSSGSHRAELREWSALNLARYRSDRAALARLSAASGGAHAAEALYLLISEAVKSKDFDAAALNFSILREAYPRAVGSFDLIDVLSNLQTDDSYDDGSAEALVGSFYSIQVGVFSVKDNANRQKERFARYGEPVNIQVKQISGKSYYAVYVGDFSSAERAEVFRTTLERAEKELYSIVLRQK
ncbi:MAG TPA: SPOR domain-containing protein, partial [candidate division Zixibacteria bacterium]|nr:SPOR domain-containing protein [candidate division Zixibacteria bacterium]